MTTIHLERHDPNKNMHRFYQLEVMCGLFNEWCLIKEWGRVGSSGSIQKNWFNTEQAANLATVKLLDAKRKKGYQVSNRSE
ncbi:MAG: WGR domain-containing protein [Methylophilaceae bacterium]|nr:WGR domain-containing protein [Methylophilaceae bacterium]